MFGKFTNSFLYKANSFIELKKAPTDTRTETEKDTQTQTHTQKHKYTETQAETDIVR